MAVRGEVWMLRRQPPCDRPVQLRKMPRKEMIGARNNGDARALLHMRGKSPGHGLELLRRAVGIEFPRHQ